MHTLFGRRRGHFIGPARAAVWGGPWRRVGRAPDKIADGIPIKRGRPRKHEPLDPNHCRWAIYCRVSTVGQGRDGQSLDAQTDRCRQYAQKAGLLPIEGSHVFADILSGTTDPLQRPGIQALLRTGATGILCICYDRLGRGDTTQLFVLQAENGTLPCGRPLLVRFVDEQERGIDGASTDGKLLVRLQRELACYEAERTAQRMRDLQAVRQAAGLAIRQVQYGETHEPVVSASGREEKRVVPVLVELQAIRFIHELRARRAETQASETHRAKAAAAGRVVKDPVHGPISWEQVCQALTAVGAPPPAKAREKGSGWTKGSVQQIHVRTQAAFEAGELPPIPGHWPRACGLSFAP